MKIKLLFSLLQDIGLPLSIVEQNLQLTHVSSNVRLFDVFVIYFCQFWCLFYLFWAYIYFGLIFILVYETPLKQTFQNNF